MNVQPKQSTYGNFEDINDVVPMGVGDRACIDELREVLERHGKLNRFGLFLAHNHFPIDEDEILIESCDAENRTLTVRVVKRKDIAHMDVIETNWNLATGIATQGCTVINHRGRGIEPRF